MKTQLPYSAKAPVYDIVSAIERIKPSLKKLEGVDLGVVQKTTGLHMITSDGISVKNKDREVTFSVDNRYSFRVKEHNNNSDTDIFVKNDFIEETKGIDKTPSAIETFLKKACELLDFPILQLRKLLNGDNLEKLFEQFVKAGEVNDSCRKIINSIETLFKQIDTNLMKVENASTRAYIKKSYPAFKTEAQANKKLEFAGIGKNGEDYSIQILNDRKSEKNIVIRITGKDNKTQNIIIEPDGKTLKFKNITSRCNLGGRSAYYPQEYLDSPEFIEHLNTLKNELEKYNSYIIERISKRDDFVTKNSTESIGIISDNDLKTIKRIHKKFDKLRETLHKLKDTSRKEMAKEKLGISTVPGDSTILFHGDEDIRLGFPPLKGQESVKILVLDKEGNITHSYCIQGTNLIKFNPTSVSRGKRNDTVNHYHTQEEIDNSNLSEYLTLLDKRLKNITKTTTSGQGWYLS